MATVHPESPKNPINRLQTARFCLWHRYRSLLMLGLFNSLVYFLFSPPVQAQSLRVLPDGRTQTNISGSLGCSSGCTITGSSRSGENLFHSFSRFSLVEGAIATFADEGAANIFTFVADEVSTINGTLAVTGAGNANLFLLNPSGVVFGPSAELSTAGSFFVSTAENVLFSDGWQFGETAAAPSSLGSSPLRISTPVGLQFGLSTGSIVNHSQATVFSPLTGSEDVVGLQVASGKTLAFLGGDISLAGGSLTANSGQVIMGSVADYSQLSLSRDLTVGYDGATGFADISMTQQAGVNVSGNRGRVAVRGRNLSLESGASISNFTFGPQLPGSIDIEIEEDLLLDRGAVLFPRTAGLVSEGVSLNLSTRRLTLENGSLILGATLNGIGNGGRVTINASESVELKGAGLSSPNYISTSSIGNGRGGDIDIVTRRLSLADGSRIESVAGGAGEGGDIVISASDRVDVTGSAPASTRSPASIFFDILGLVFESTTTEPAVSGILATSGLTEVDSTEITGAGGSLTLSTGVLSVSDRAQVAVSSFGAGDSGDLEIMARSVQLNSRAQLAAAAPLSDGGNLRLSGLETLIINGASQVSTSAGTGDGGNISIDADFIIANPLEDSDIIARATDGRGGNIEINALGLYGIEQRRAIAGNATNDIDASSDFGVSGETAINEVVSDVDLTLPTLAGIPLNTSLSVTQRCGASGNRFVVTGRGGLPMAPAGSTESWESVVDLGEDFAAATADYGRVDEESLFPLDPNAVAGPSLEAENSRLIEAKGWRTNQAGEVVLSEEAGQNSSVLPTADSTCAG